MIRVLPTWRAGAVESRCSAPYPVRGLCDRGEVPPRQHAAIDSTRPDPPASSRAGPARACCRASLCSSARAPAQPGVSSADFRQTSRYSHSPSSGAKSSPRARYRRFPRYPGHGVGRGRRQWSVPPPCVRFGVVPAADLLRRMPSRANGSSSSTRVPVPRSRFTGAARAAAGRPGPRCGGVAGRHHPACVRRGKADQLVLPGLEPRPIGAIPGGAGALGFFLHVEARQAAAPFNLSTRLASTLCGEAHIEVQARVTVGVVAQDTSTSSWLACSVSTTTAEVRRQRRTRARARHTQGLDLRQPRRLALGPQQQCRNPSAAQPGLSPNRSAVARGPTPSA